MSFSQLHKKKRRWPWILLAIVIVCMILVGSGVLLLKRMGVAGIISSPLVRSQLVNSGLVEQDLFDLLPRALGFIEPHTYLLLFLNNTELRPGGGFIGSYSTVRMNRGNYEVLALEGTELLDYRNKNFVPPIAPAPIMQYLKVPGWYFRDSNWSPDFAESTKMGLSLYAQEGGVAADEIDAVIGVTTHVLEEVMQITGPLTVDGITFTPQNVVAELEREVEYDFVDRGIARTDRKVIIKDLMIAIVDKLKSDVLLHPLKYKALAEKLIQQKHVMIYATDPSIQDLVISHGASGMVTSTTGDYLMWVDANLGALKTDHAITRTLWYHIEPAISAEGESYYRAVTTMEYVHGAPFDWRTSRYISYARVYVPEGAELISVEATPRQARDIPSIETGFEFGTQWFGTVIAVEPLTTKKLTFTYRLPQAITDQIGAGSYELYVQKQLGLFGSQLTLNLDFGTTIQSARPAELSSEWGDMVYRFNTPFESDAVFRVGF